MEEGQADPGDSRRLAICWHNSHLHSAADSADASVWAGEELG